MSQLPLDPEQRIPLDPEQEEPHRLVSAKLSPANMKKDVIPVKMKKPDSSRLTVIDQVVLRSPDDQDVSVESRFVAPCKTKGEPYIRTRVELTEEWGQVDSGWVHRPSMVFFRNLEGEFRQVQPTQTEREEMAARIVEVWLGEKASMPPPLRPSVGTMIIPPGESLRFRFTADTKILVRCLKGTARISTYFFPE